jgi:hypothetical protein
MDSPLTSHDGRGVRLLHIRAPRHSSIRHSARRAGPLSPSCAHATPGSGARLLVAMFAFALVVVGWSSRAIAQELVRFRASAEHLAMGSHPHMGAQSLASPSSLRMAYAPAELVSRAHAMPVLEVLAQGLWRGDGSAVELYRPAAPAAPTATEMIQRIGSLDFLSTTVLRPHRLYQQSGEGTPIVQQITPSLRIAPTFGAGAGYGLQAIGTFF